MTNGDRKCKYTFINFLNTCYSVSHGISITINRRNYLKRACFYRQAAPVDGSNQSVFGDIDLSHTGTPDSTSPTLSTIAILNNRFCSVSTWQHPLSLLPSNHINSERFGIPRISLFISQKLVEYRSRSKCRKTLPLISLFFRSVYTLCVFRMLFLFLFLN